MKLLVLGGTRFLGRAVVGSALGAGHEVTIFHRGRHGADLFPTEVERLRGDRNGDLAPLHDRRWDAVVDTFGFVPTNMEHIADALGTVERYVFVSTVAVALGTGRTGLPEDEAVRTATAEEIAHGEVVEPGEIPGASYGPLYGPLKASSEEVVRRRYGEGATIIRPGLIVGPGDFAGDRFSYWPHRIRRGGRVLAPGAPSDPFQCIDVRDLGTWIVRLLEDGTPGTFNAAGPATPTTMATFVDVCRTVTGCDPELVWAGDDALRAAGAEPGRDLPLWQPGIGHLLNTATIDRALASGLALRGLDATIGDVLAADDFDEDLFERRLTREGELLAALASITTGPTGGG